MKVMKCICYDRNGKEINKFAIEINNLTCEAKEHYLHFAKMFIDSKTQEVDFIF